MYGVLILGAGWVARQHAAAYAANPLTRIVAICDRLKERAAAMANELGLTEVGLYDDLDEALRQTDIQMVSICTPQHLHCEHAVRVAGAGKHMIIEKPMAITREQTQRIAEAVRQAGVKSVVSFVLRWNPLLVLLKQMVCRGTFGRPYYLEVDYMSNNGSWWGGWNDGRTLAQGVSASLVAGCHAIDAARWLASTDPNAAAIPVSVMAMAGGFRKGTCTEYHPILNRWIEDAPPMEYDGLELICVRFSSGAIAKICVNAECIMPYRFPIRIFGDRGTAMDQRIWSHEFPGQTNWIEIPTILPDSSHVSHHPFQAEIDHFVECVHENRESHCNAVEAAISHGIVFDALDCYAAEHGTNV